jgi:hypothetical protein
MATLEAYLEMGSRRVFAGALDWPGWCRSGRDENAALEALVAYGRRYKDTLGRAARGFAPPKDPSALDVVERLRGNATTDFGAPGIPPSADDRALDGRELDRYIRVLEASWAAVDEAAKAAKGKTLRKGPRGGGRELEAIESHVTEAGVAYLAGLGDRYRAPQGASARAAREGLRATMLETLRLRARGEPPPRPGRSQRWSPRYFVRREAWHVLDHVWEIEDRAID